MNKKELLSKFIEKNNYTIPNISKEEEKRYRTELLKSMEFIGFVLDYRLDVFLSKFWKDVYIIYTSTKVRIIRKLRNYGRN